MHISLIDLSPIPYNGNRQKALANTIETAQLAEKWGYKRIWLAEHHNSPTLAGRAPEVVIPVVAANTDRIRVGSGAILLNHYSPFKVAEVFATLTELFPNRIDLGIGRATTGPLSDLALQQDRTKRRYTDDPFDQLTELLQWFAGDMTGLMQDVKVYQDNNMPEFHLLGSSPWSAKAAASLGLNYVFAAFINPYSSFEITQEYINTFEASKLSTGSVKPHLTLALNIYCSDTDDIAISFSAPMQAMMMRLRQGDLLSPFMSENEATKLMGKDNLIKRLQNPEQPPYYIVGNTKTVLQEIRSIQKAFGFDELMVQCISPNHAARLRSIELLSQLVVPE